MIRYCGYSFGQHKRRFRVEGYTWDFIGILPPNHTEKKMENEMATGMLKWFILIRASHNSIGVVYTLENKHANYS